VPYAVFRKHRRVLRAREHSKPVQGTPGKIGALLCRTDLLEMPRGFGNDASGYTVLHLATHGVLDEASPLYSHLVLSRSPDGEEGGRLEAWEIMRMKLDADLVVLAACETGRGRIAPGEGMIGMMWALFAAGARSMVVSQFRVESRSATSLLVAFHTRVAGGGDSKAAQLRAAALTLLHNPKYGHPYYWSGFILVGDSD
jgi:CHAT domain-containing protein